MWDVQVLSTVSSDTEPSILVRFDSFKYLFNCGENTTRGFLQSKRNWKRTKCLFFTSPTVERAGGLAGMLMTFADSTIPRLDVIGPPGMKHFMASMRFYTFRKNMPVIPSETSQYIPNSLTPEPAYKDQNITVYSIPIYLSDEAAITDADSNNQEEVLTENGKRKPVGQPEDQPPAKKPHAEPLSDAQDITGRMIDVMFPASVAARKQDRKQRDKKQGVKETRAGNNDDGQGNVDEYRRSSLPEGYHNQLPKYPGTPGANSYIVVGPRLRGKFNAEKAKELGIPSGRLRGQLTSGQTVTFTYQADDGVDEEGKPKKKDVTRTVKPEEVLGETESPGVVLIMDVPSPSHIPSAVEPFSSSPFFKRFRSSAEEDITEYGVRAVFHICGEGVLEDERYKEFMRGFNEDAEHIVASRQHAPDPVTFTSAAYNQLRLSQVDDTIFRVPKFKLTPKTDLSSVTGLPLKTHVMASNQGIKISPKGPLTVDPEIEELDRFHPIIKTSGVVPLSESTRAAFATATATVKQVAMDKENCNDSDVPGADVRIITLGTGSAVPNKYRNVSATLIMIPKYGNILLDCGEGTWGQLSRHFGTDEATEENVYKVLKDLKAVYVSHLHGDHQMGIPNLLAKRKQFLPNPTEPLYLVGPRALHIYLRELSDLRDLGIFDEPSKNGVVTVLSPALHWRNQDTYASQGMWRVGGDEPWLDIDLSKDEAAKMCQALGLREFKTVDVRHRTRCYGAVICHNDGWSIVFSGDTVPTDTLLYASPSATVLIHEATMADDQEDLAAKKAHSTIGQALDIGRRMNARNILLTHFSARYPKIITLKGDKGKDGKEGDTEKEGTVPFDPDRGVVAIAFDHADMKIVDMWKINYYLSALESSFQQTVVEDGDEGDVEKDVAAAAMHAH